MKIICDLHIGRPQGGNGPEVMTIELTDRASRIRFLELQIPLAEFMKALTGKYLNHVEGSVMGLEFVGKTRVTESRSVLCPLKSYKSEELEKWLENNQQEEGWTINSRLHSQGSIRGMDDGTILNYSVFKFVDQEP